MRIMFLKICKMKKYLILLFIAVATMLFASCTKECTCSMWTDGKNTDTNPVVYTQDEISRLNVKNCAGLNDYYNGLGLGYDETIKSGIKCE